MKKLLLSLIAAVSIIGLGAPLAASAASITQGAGSSGGSLTQGTGSNGSGGSLTTGTGGSGSGSTSGSSSYDIQNQVCTGIDPSAKCDDNSTDVTNLFKNIINVMSLLIGSISIIMVIIGGFRYVVSGGESNSVAGAKNTILYAIVGLVVALMAQVIVRFVFHRTVTPATK